MDFTSKNFIEANSPDASVLSVLSDKLKDGVFIADSRKRLVFVNAQFMRMLGYSDAEEFETHFLGTETDFVHRLVAQVDNNTNNERAFLEFTKKDDSKIRSCAIGFPLMIQEEKHYVGLVRPSCDQSETLAALNESTERYRNLVESSPMGIHMYTLDDSNHLVFEGYNTAAEQILGVPHTQFVGKTIENAFPPLANTEVPTRYREAALTGKTWSSEQIQYEDAKISGAFEIKAFQTKPRAMAVMFWDITEKKRFEAALKEARDELEERVSERTQELEQANQELTNLTARLVHSAKMAALGELTSGIAHELNQPLNGMKIINQGLLLDMKRDRFELDKLPQKLDAVVSMINKMADTIGHMRIFTREPNRGAFDRIDLNDVVEGSFSFLEEQFKNNNIEVRKELSPTPLPVHAEAAELEQVMLNLLSNSRYALLNSQKPNKVLIVRTKTSEGFAVIEVEDNGDGIGDDIHDKIFVPFFTTKDQGVGIGLGLSVSQKIVEESGGQITFESNPGEFARFDLRFSLMGK